MKYRNGFLDVQNLQKQWRLDLSSTCNAEGKKFLQFTIDKAHVATAHVGIGKTMKALTSKFECQSFSRLVKKYVGSCNICQRT